MPTMTYQVRMLAPPNVKSAVTHTGSNKQINDTPGTLNSYDNHIADFLESNGYTRVAPTGTTAQRPGSVVNAATGMPSVYRGMFYYDTTLGALIIYDGLNWRSVVNGSVV